jgi:hypothetical protein
MYLSRKLIAGIVAILAVAGGATALAAIPDGNGVIHGCYDTKTGALRVLDWPTNGMSLSCAPKEGAVTWNQQGPKGDRGPSNAYWKGGVATTLTANAWTTVTTRTLPPGRYVTSAKVNLKANGANVPLTSVECGLAVETPNFGAYDYAYGAISSDASGHGLYATLALENDNTGILVQGGSLSLRCLSPSPAVAFGGVITAIQVESLDSQ